ncbi:KpsF/GutQ family sugar-phosphate isomerase [Pedobacter changchengzhani]|uniref:KpsF/GutQ family sugar-phosphate isomerase n=1 Tax=Pedobacter changchengzhani TaxID=2529274 RepID=A0A4R5MKC5_9SPHI|nr:KpsF/GutQ family sugar-phosphate isomerase [Pedobacter changchengzhani]TDG36114.1 KpsF/GutQ family sugar-phosphate isomerase [Pedobacter changchengzhani]
MKSKISIIESAISTLQLEAAAILNVAKNINADFEKVVNAILKIDGRVIVTGIGKSAIIAQKIVASLNSTGTPAIFMHAADAIHGDLGMIQKNDVVICLSKSGNTPEIKVLIPLLKLSGNLLVGMVGELNSFLAQHADLILNTAVEREACPHNLAPTTSTTAQLAMGDALVVCLLECRDFNEKDFAKYHPGGSLGKKLYLKAGDIARSNEKPCIKPSASVKDVLIEISKNRLGAVVVTNDNDKVLGIITDGDIRRMLENFSNIENLIAEDIMGTNPKNIQHSELAVHALEMLKENNITQLLVLEKDTYFGIIHLHDLLKEGIV